MDKTLLLEDSDRVGIIDFISHGCSVRCAIKGGKLFIAVNATRGNRDSSEFECADYEFGLPEYDPEGADDDNDYRCPHGMRFSGAGACPQCGGGADIE